MPPLPERKRKTPAGAMPHRKSPQHPPRKPPSTGGKLPKPVKIKKKDDRWGKKPPLPTRKGKK